MTNPIQEIRDIDRIQELLPYLNQIDPEILSETALRIGRLALEDNISEQTIDPLCKLFSHPVDNVIENAVWALSQMASKNVYSRDGLFYAILLLKHKNDEVRYWATYLIRILATKGVIIEQSLNLMLDILLSPNEDIREEASNAIEEIIEKIEIQNFNPYYVLEALTNKLQDVKEQNQEVKQHLAGSIGNIFEKGFSYPSAFSALSKCLDINNGIDLKINSSWALGLLVINLHETDLDRLPHGATATLLPLLDDKDEDVKEYAAWAIIQFIQIGRHSFNTSRLITNHLYRPDNGAKLNGYYIDAVGELANQKEVENNAYRFLLSKLAEPDSQLNSHAIGALSKISSIDPLPDFITTCPDEILNLLTNEDSCLRIGAIKYISNITRFISENNLKFSNNVFFTKNIVPGLTDSILEIKIGSYQIVANLLSQGDEFDEVVIKSLPDLLNGLTDNHKEIRLSSIVSIDLLSERKKILTDVEPILDKLIICLNDNNNEIVSYSLKLIHFFVSQNIDVGIIGDSIFSCLHRNDLDIVRQSARLIAYFSTKKHSLDNSYLALLNAFVRIQSIEVRNEIIQAVLQIPELKENAPDIKSALEKIVESSLNKKSILITQQTTNVIEQILKQKSITILPTRRKKGQLTQGSRVRISHLKFSLLSPDEIRKMSAIKIITADTYNDDGFPIDQGLMDTHLGVIEPGLMCKTCGHKVDECPGHFGNIDLAMPVIHVGYVKEIKKLLQATCKSCGRLVLTEDDVKEYQARLDTMEELGSDAIDLREFAKETAKAAAEKATKEVCPHCGVEQLKITLDKPTTFREDGHKLTPKEVRERLERIPDNDLIPLGIDPNACRPEWMVLTALPVPPVTVRPSITLESGDRSEDDLTHKLVDVLRINQRLRENRDAGAPQLIVEDLWELLQYHVTTYFDNQTTGIPPARHRSGRPLKTLVQRLKGKEGRIRSNLSGKRVNFSAHTVVSPDPWLSINQVGVPTFAARELTVPVMVTKDNLEILRAMVKRGPEPARVVNAPDVNYIMHPNGNMRFLTDKNVEPAEAVYEPGVNYIIRVDGRRIRVTEKNAETVAEGLEIGYKVERHLMDGDVVLFNRQPSLHRMSMMAHVVKVMPGKTFRLNLCVCPPYNADFDGDEMNLHVLQSEEARAEAHILMKVQEHILSPRFGGPIIGAIHDHITGLFQLTHKNPKYNKREVMGMLSDLRNIDFPTPFLEGDDEFWNGKDLFSTLLPKDFQIKFRSHICLNCPQCKKDDCEHDAFVKIQDGKLLMGTIDSRAVGSGEGRILDKIAREYGPDCARVFIEDVSRLSICSLFINGFTIGLDDVEIPGEAKEEIEIIIRAKIQEIDQLLVSHRNETMEQTPVKSPEETLDMKIIRKLDEVRDDAGRIAENHLGLNNAAVKLFRSGARGSSYNLSQMVGCIGQQLVYGKRPSRGYSGRITPHFKRGDDKVESRGFVKGNLKNGINPVEYFFLAMGSRSHEVNSVVRTPRSGYLQRRLVNALMDLKIANDGTVRNAENKIIQFMYGEDGIDPCRSIHGEAIDLDDILVQVLGDGFAGVASKSRDRINSYYGMIEKDMIAAAVEYEEDDDEDETIDIDDNI